MLNLSDILTRLDSSFTSPIRSGSLPWPSVNVLCFALLAWIATVRAFRWRRYNHIHRVYGPKYQAGTLNADDAQEILWILSRYEMPSVMELSTAFVIFKTDAIVSRAHPLQSSPRSNISPAIHIQTPRLDR
ncbi:hypothetical protein E1B28_009055 [Marasmius oreades]|uniref:Uncharacterized protein n=1 Tax=Marasmius oreades TaxID=181124 RepID=A0A9P7RZM9_9AGAR|nr:uncharacterized protein E1B28_009055 [Marasmius oreades]KAG7092726.1 hypothetical protein E1B28_009055 [Marasmius oreades]